jgi:hypothetical protein
MISVMHHGQHNKHGARSFKDYHAEDHSRICTFLRNHIERRAQDLLKVAAMLNR